jgi:hypothetical protein
LAKTKDENNLFDNNLKINKNKEELQIIESRINL